MVLSDRTIKTLLAEGKIVVEPLGEGCYPPSLCSSSANTGHFYYLR